MISKIEIQKNKFGVYIKCNNPKSNFNWCPSCNCAKLIKNFNDWTSGNDELDEFIRYTQSTSKSYLSYLEWIPHERFENIIIIGSVSFIQQLGKMAKELIIIGTTKIIIFMNVVSQFLLL